jgi:uncharacterized protein AF_1681
VSLTTSYLSSTKNLESIFNSIINARAPERFTTKFLEDLGFKSSTDRLMVGMLKALGLLDENGQPTQRYYEFLDQSQSKKVIAKGIQEAYEDLFNLRKDAQNMSNEDVKNKLKTLTQGQKGDRVIDQMSLTFRALCNYADWTEDPIDQNPTKSTEGVEQKSEVYSATKTTGPASSSISGMNLHYNIQIHLPETTNMAVYDAIFQSLKKASYVRKVCKIHYTRL